MARQVYSHFEEELQLTPDFWGRRKRLLTNKQHGYRAKLSCCSNIVQLLDSILHNSQRGYETALTMCDLSAAFDCVPHSILIEKLKLYGFSDDSIHSVPC